MDLDPEGHRRSLAGDLACGWLVEDLAKGGPVLRVFSINRPQIDHPHQWAVWLDPGPRPCDGTCIGIGQTREAAIAQALETLRAATVILEHWCPHGFDLRRLVCSHGCR
jgi:hypothetical protein